MILRTERSTSIQLDLLNSKPDQHHCDKEEGFYNLVYSCKLMSFVMVQGRNNTCVGVSTAAALAAKFISTSFETALCSSMRHQALDYTADSKAAESDLYLGIKFDTEGFKSGKDQLFPELPVSMDLEDWTVGDRDFDIAEVKLTVRNGTLSFDIGAATGITCIGSNLDMRYVDVHTSLERFISSLAYEVISVFDSIANKMLKTYEDSQEPSEFPATLSAAASNFPSFTLPEPNTITFTAGGSQILMIKPDGEIHWRGKRVEGDEDFKEAMKGLAESLKTTLNLVPSNA